VSEYGAIRRPSWNAKYQERSNPRVVQGQNAGIGAIQVRRGAPSVVGGAIRGRRGVPSADHGVIRGTERSVTSTSAKCCERSNPRAVLGVKGWAPSQIGGQRWAKDVERRAICAKQRTPSVEHGAIRDRGERKVSGMEQSITGAER